MLVDLEFLMLATKIKRDKLKNDNPAEKNNNAQQNLDN